MSCNTHGARSSPIPQHNPMAQLPLSKSPSAALHSISFQLPNLNQPSPRAPTLYPKVHPARFRPLPKPPSPTKLGHPQPFRRPMPYPTLLSRPQRNRRPSSERRSQHVRRHPRGLPRALGICQAIRPSVPASRMRYQLLAVLHQFLLPASRSSGVYTE
jgi:hypothetical protein